MDLRPLRSNKICVSISRFSVREVSMAVSKIPRPIGPKKEFFPKKKITSKATQTTYQGPTRRSDGTFVLVKSQFFGKSLKRGETFCVCKNPSVIRGKTFVKDTPETVYKISDFYKTVYGDRTELIIKIVNKCMRNELLLEMFAVSFLGLLSFLFVVMLHIV